MLLIQCSIYKKIYLSSHFLNNKGRAYQNRAWQKNEYQSDELRNLLSKRWTQESTATTMYRKRVTQSFHLNISSLPYHYSELHSLLSNCRSNFDIIGITESRLKQSEGPSEYWHTKLQHRALPNRRSQWWCTDLC